MINNCKMISSVGPAQMSPSSEFKSEIANKIKRMSMANHTISTEKTKLTATITFSGGNEEKQQQGLMRSSTTGADRLSVNVTLPGEKPTQKSVEVTISDLKKLDCFQAVAKTAVQNLGGQKDEEISDPLQNIKLPQPLRKQLMERSRSAGATKTTSSVVTSRSKSIIGSSAMAGILALGERAEAMLPEPLVVAKPSAAPEELSQPKQIPQPVMTKESLAKRLRRSASMDQEENSIPQKPPMTTKESLATKLRRSASMDQEENIPQKPSMTSRSMRRSRTMSSDVKIEPQPPANNRSSLRGSIRSSTGNLKSLVGGETSLIPGGEGNGSRSTELLKDEVVMTNQSMRLGGRRRTSTADLKEKATMESQSMRLDSSRRSRSTTVGDLKKIAMDSLSMRGTSSGRRSYIGLLCDEEEDDDPLSSQSMRGTSSRRSSLYSECEIDEDTLHIGCRSTATSDLKKKTALDSLSMRVTSSRRSSLYSECEIDEESLHSTALMDSRSMRGPSSRSSDIGLLNCEKEVSLSSQSMRGTPSRRSCLDSKGEMENNTLVKAKSLHDRPALRHQTNNIADNSGAKEQARKKMQRLRRRESLTPPRATRELSPPVPSSAAAVEPEQTEESNGDISPTPESCRGAQNVSTNSRRFRRRASLTGGASNAPISSASNSSRGETSPTPPLESSGTPNASRRIRRPSSRPNNLTPGTTPDSTHSRSRRRGGRRSMMHTNTVGNDQLRQALAKKDEEAAVPNVMNEDLDDPDEKEETPVDLLTPEEAAAQQEEKKATYSGGLTKLFNAYVAAPLIGKSKETVKELSTLASLEQRSMESSLASLNYDHTADNTNLSCDPTPRTRLKQALPNGGSTRQRRRNSCSGALTTMPASEGAGTDAFILPMVMAAPISAAKKVKNSLPKLQPENYMFANAPAGLYNDLNNDSDSDEDDDDDNSFA